MTLKSIFDSSFVKIFLLCGVCLGFVGCSGVNKEAKYPSGLERSETGDDIYAKKQSILGEGGLSIFGGKGKKDAENTGIGVNSYLWRASLDTISFMPLASADPFGGAIITEWYSAPENQNERVKLNILIMGSALKAEGVQVKTFRQEKRNGEWADVSVATQTNRALEDTILTRARQLRVSGLQPE